MEFAYNGLGDRVTQTMDGDTTTYVLDTAAGLTQVLADDDTAYLYGLGRIAQQGATATEYFLGDALGSVRQLVDGDGAVTLARGYEPYGVVLGSSGSGASDFGFTGEAQDARLIYLRGRYYSQGTGRFTQLDPTRLEANLYLYAAANPVNLTDPSGYWNQKTCKVQQGDSLYSIAGSYLSDPAQIGKLVNKIRKANGLKVADDRLLPVGKLLIVPGYCEPGSPGPGSDPGNVLHHRDMLAGYIEGTGTTLSLLGFVFYVSGREVVYDFATRERAEFTYSGNYVLGFACGLTTDIASGDSNLYFGTFNFPDKPSLEGAYSGNSMSISTGVGAPPPFDRVAGLASFAASAFISTSGEPFLGIPTVTDRSLVGATFSVGIGKSISALRVPVNVTQTFLTYTMVDFKYYEYDSAKEMANDILSGAHSENLSALDEKGMFSTTREWFAGHLRWMYTP